MTGKRNHAFITLFREAFQKCFGFQLAESLSETESRHFSNKIFEDTGLVIGAKSLKNYSVYVSNNDELKQENPSVATLDTLARYVLNAPYTDEVKRKENESHHPYWFQYQNAVADKNIDDEEAVIDDKKKPSMPGSSRRIVFLLAAVIAILVMAIYWFSPKGSKNFTEDFHTVKEDSLKDHGWFLQARDNKWWNKRDEMSSHLTLYTLMGDSWSDSVHTPVIQNLLLRKITTDCFTTEVHLDDFIPLRRWQQAGIILLEDTSLSGKSLRLSFAYNDFFGGYDKPKEIIIQAVSAAGSSTNNPEEIIHLPLFSMDPGKDSLVKSNLQKSALRIEKNGSHFRFLYAAGQADNFAFKEILTKDIAIHPKYIGIFALGGFVNDTSYISAHFKYFNLLDTRCEEY